jgi:acyl dehydratase
MTADVGAPIGHLGDDEIGPADLAELEKEIGVKHEVIPVGVEVFNRDVYRDYATYCIANQNPLWLDDDYARASGFEGIQPPPTVEYVSSSRDLTIGGFGLHERGIMSLHMFDEWEFFAPVQLGDQVTPFYELLSVELKQSRHAAGQAMHQVMRFAYHNQNGQLLSTWTKGSFRARRPMRTEPLQPREEYHYTREEIDEIHRGMENEEVRGRKARLIGDVAVGDSLGPIVKGPFTQMDMICWWMGAKGPFLYPFKVKYELFKANPGLAIVDPETGMVLTPEDAHWDRRYAARNGVDGIYDGGKQRTAAVTHLATNWMGDHGKLKKLRLKMMAPNMVGDTTWYTGQVIEKYPETRTVTCRVEGRNQRGTVHCEGYVVIELPSAES